MKVQKKIEMDLIPMSPGDPPVWLNNRIAVGGPLSCIQILISNTSLLLVSIWNVSVFDKG